MLISQDLKGFCRRNLTNWVFMPPITRAAWLRRHLETGGLKELCDDFGRYQKIRPQIWPSAKLLRLTALAM